MADVSGFVLTREQIEQIEGWEREFSQLEVTITQCERRMSVLRAKLDAVAVLRDEASKAAVPATSPGRMGSTGPNETMMDAIDRMVAAKASPTQRSDLKDLLSAAGFPKSRLGNYFYTAVARLKERERIAVLENGDLAPGPHSHFLSRKQVETPEGQS